MDLGNSELQPDASETSNSKDFSLFDSMIRNGNTDETGFDLRHKFVEIPTFETVFDSLVNGSYVERIVSGENEPTIYSEFPEAQLLGEVIWGKYADRVERNYIIENSENASKKILSFSQYSESGYSFDNHDNEKFNILFRDCDVPGVLENNKTFTIQFAEALIAENSFDGYEFNPQLLLDRLLELVNTKPSIIDDVADLLSRGVGFSNVYSEWLLIPEDNRGVIFNYSDKLANAESFEEDVTAASESLKQSAKSDVLQMLNDSNFANLNLLTIGFSDRNRNIIRAYNRGLRNLNNYYNDIFKFYLHSKFDDKLFNSLIDSNAYLDEEVFPSSLMSAIYFRQLAYSSDGKVILNRAKKAVKVGVYPELSSVVFKDILADDVLVGSENCKEILREIYADYLSKFTTLRTTDTEVPLGSLVHYSEQKYMTKDQKVINFFRNALLANKYIDSTVDFNESISADQLESIILEINRLFITGDQDDYQLFYGGFSQLVSPFVSFSSSLKNIAGKRRVAEETRTVFDRNMHRFWGNYDWINLEIPVDIDEGYNIQFPKLKSSLDRSTNGSEKASVEDLMKIKFPNRSFELITNNTALLTESITAMHLVIANLQDKIHQHEGLDRLYYASCSLALFQQIGLHSQFTETVLNSVLEMFNSHFFNYLGLPIKSHNEADTLAMVLPEHQYGKLYTMLYLRDAHAKNDQIKSAFMRSVTSNEQSSSVTLDMKKIDEQIAGKWHPYRRLTLSDFSEDKELEKYHAMVTSPQFQKIQNQIKLDLEEYRQNMLLA